MRIFWSILHHFLIFFYYIRLFFDRFWIIFHPFFEHLWFFKIFFLLYSTIFWTFLIAFDFFFDHFWFFLLFFDHFLLLFFDHFFYYYFLIIFYCFWFFLLLFFDHFLLLLIFFIIIFWSFFIAFDFFYYYFLIIFYCFWSFFCDFFCGFSKIPSRVKNMMLCILMKSGGHWFLHCPLHRCTTIILSFWAWSVSEVPPPPKNQVSWPVFQGVFCCFFNILPSCRYGLFDCVLQLRRHQRHQRGPWSWLYLQNPFFSSNFFLDFFPLLFPQINATTRMVLDSLR